MPEPNPHEVTQLLLAWSEGDKAALNQLMPLVYAELRRLAKRHRRNERAGQTMQTTALIHEAYLRLVDADQVRLENRGHFFAAAARLMRQVLYEMLAGRRPFEGATASDVMAAALTNEPVSLVEVVPEVPAVLWRIVRRCLEKQPEKRFQAAGDLAFALAELSVTSGVSPGAEAATVAQPHARGAPPLLRRFGKGLARWGWLRWRWPCCSLRSSWP